MLCATSVGCVTVDAMPVLGATVHSQPLRRSRDTGEGGRAVFAVAAKALVIRGVAWSLIPCSQRSQQSPKQSGSAWQAGQLAHKGQPGTVSDGHKQQMCGVGALNM